jgi:hypothetical protein
MLDTVLNGLRVFNKYVDKNIAVEHDVIYAGSAPPEAMPSDDLKVLEDNRWYWDKELESWYTFV